MGIGQCHYFRFVLYYLQLCLNHLNKRRLNGSNWCYSPSAKALEAFVGDQLYWTWQVRSSISVGVFGARAFSCIDGESLMRKNAKQKVLLPVFHPSLSKENECKVQSHRHDAGPNPSRLDITLCCGAVKPLFEPKDEIVAGIICCRHCFLGYLNFVKRNPRDIYSCSLPC